MMFGVLTTLLIFMINGKTVYTSPTPDGENTWLWKATGYPNLNYYPLDIDENQAISGMYDSLK